MSSRSSRRPQRSPADDAHAHGGGGGDHEGGNAEQVSQPRPPMAVAVPALPESAARRRRTSSGSGGSGSDADSKHASFEPPASTSSGASARRGRARSRSRSITRNNENDDKERVDQRVEDVAVAGAGTAAEAASPMHTQVATSSASAPPIVTVEVTRTTRRQTFGETAIPTERSSVVGGKKSSSGAGTSAAARTGRALVVHQGAIANTRSSSSEDSTSGMLDLFSPPMPSAEARDRSRSRSTSRSRSSRPAEVDLAAAVTASASVEDTAGAGYHADHQQQQQQQRGYGNVVHLPKQRESAATAIVAGSGRAADAIERNPGVDFHYDSNESADFNAALQLTFDESPENSPRDSEREELKQESRAGVSSGQHHSRHGDHQDRSRESEGYDSQQHQQQQYHYPPGAPGYYSHPPHQQHQQGSGSWPATAQGYPHQQYPPSSPANVSAAQQGEVAPGYPPPPPPPPGYQWAPAAAGQQPPQRGGQPYQPPGGYYYPHQPPPAHQAQHYHPGMPPPAPHPMTPSSARTPASKRKGRNLNVNTTMETAELSYDQPDDGELRVVGPVSPPSSKKKRSGTAWGSPPRGSLDQEATPQRGSTYASRRRSEQDRSQPSPYHQQTGTPHSLQQSHELRPTGGAELFPTESWSPSAMGAFFDEDSNLGSTAPAPAPFAATSGGSDVARADHTLSHYPHRDAPNMPPFVSAMSPTRGGITIRGSPISRANRPHPVATPVRQPEEAHETPSRDTQFPQQYQSSWQTPSSAKTSASMRIKIGGVGMESTREIEGINSVLRGSPVETPYKHPPHGGGLQPYHPHMKMDYAPTSGQRSVAMTPAASAARQGTGKENSDNGPSTFKGSTQPCNCKKSKCLKLYCECFAAEKFCMGCKCLDCHNTPAFESIRNKAIADTKAKNPNAFKEKMTQNSSHAVGCKCKRSACLKKYCECFQAGIVCGAKCKCVNCKNFVGSQALIDRRRKIKDHKGAEIAMKSSEKAWKGSLSDTKVGLRTTGTLGQSPIVHDPTRAQSKTTNWSIMSPLAAYSPAHQPPPGRPQHEYPPGFVYSPYPHAAGMPQQSPMVYHVPHPPPPYSAGRVEGLVKTPMTPSAPQGYPRSPGRRVKRLTPPKEIEAKVEYFGPDVAAVTKSAALKIFAYLNNDELFCASIVSKKWCDVAFDKEGKGVFGLDAQSTLA